jgi:hypothetical protein
MFKKFTLNYLFENIASVLGVVLIWRGIWMALDYLDGWIFGGSHFWTAMIGVLLGLIILFAINKDLKHLGS